MIETALTLTMLLVMLLGVVEVGGLAYAAMQVTSAARAAVQYGDINLGTAQDTQGMQNAAAFEAPSVPNLSTVPSTSCVCTDGSACHGSGFSCGSTSAPITTLHVTTSAIYTPFITLPGLPSSFKVDAESYQQVLSN